MTLIHNIQNIHHNNDILVKYLNYETVEVKDINLSLLSEKDQQTFHSFKSPKRQLEFYHLRVLWDSFNTQQPILYKSTGKPYLKQGFLSMTHSHKRVVIAYSPVKEVGVDIELISPKIDKVKHKFLHPNDNYRTLEDLTVLWTIKEAVYKLFDGDDLFFMDNVEVKDLTSQIAEINHNHLNLKAETKSKIIENDYILSLATTF